MKLVDFKTAALVLTNTQIKQVFFDYTHINKVTRAKLYPYVLWNLNSWAGKINWANTNNRKEHIKVKVFCFDYFDRGASTETQSREAVWDDIRDYFRVYCTALNTQSKVQITNLNDMPFEYFSIGISNDAEIAVSFDIELDLFC